MVSGDTVLTHYGCLHGVATTNCISFHQIDSILIIYRYHHPRIPSFLSLSAVAHRPAFAGHLRPHRSHLPVWGIRIRDAGGIRTQTTSVANNGERGGQRAACDGWGSGAGGSGGSACMCVQRGWACVCLSQQNAAPATLLTRPRAPSSPPRISPKARLMAFAPMLASL